MSSGRTHTKTSVIISACLFVLLVNYGLMYSVLVCTGVLVGVFLTPDLDVDAGYIGNFYLRKHVGLWADKLWGLYWHLYSKAVPHRSNISHAPFLGTAIRYIYFSPIIVILLSAAKIIFSYFAWRELFLIFIGNCIADSAHWVLDNK